MICDALQLNDPAEAERSKRLKEDWADSEWFQVWLRLARTNTGPARSQPRLQLV